MVARLSSDQAGALERTVALLGDLGHDVVERDPDYGWALATWTRAWLGSQAAERDALGRGGPFEASTRQMAVAGRLVLPRKQRDDVRRHWEPVARRVVSLWEDIDVLVTPVLARTALAAEGGYGRSAPVAINLSGSFSPWTAVFNLTGQPAVALPAGMAPDGLPTSVHLVGAPGQEAMLYSLAAQLEEADPWAGRIPPLAAA